MSSKSSSNASSGAPAPRLDKDDVADFARLGLQPEQLQPAAGAAPAAKPAPADADLVLAPHLWPAVQLAHALRSQARVVAGMSGLLYLGLDYARVDGTKRDLGLPMRGKKSALLWRQFQTLESEMVNVWNSGRVAP